VVIFRKVNTHYTDTENPEVAQRTDK
jgi:hypothetical protein